MTYKNTVLWPVLAGALASLLIAQLVLLGDLHISTDYDKQSGVHPGAVVVFEHIDESDDQVHRNVVVSWSVLKYTHTPRSGLRELYYQSPPVKPPNT